MSPHPPPAAADGPDPGPAQRPGRQGGEGEGRPTPVRELLEGSAPGPGGAATDAESTTFEVEGQAWVARVLGRGRVGPTPAAAPLLLLGFHEEGGPEEPVREALLTARDLASLTPSQLGEAFRSGAAPPDPSARRELFPESSSKRRRGAS